MCGLYAVIPFLEGRRVYLEVLSVEKLTVTIERCESKDLAMVQDVKNNVVLVSIAVVVSNNHNSIRSTYDSLCGLWIPDTFVA